MKNHRNPRGEWEEKKERNALVYKLREQGMSYDAIGRREEIGRSRQRVKQIYDNYKKKYVTPKS